MLHEAVSLQPPLLLFFSSSSSLSFFLYVGNGGDHSTTLVLAVSLSSLSLLTRRVQILDPSSKSCFANRKRAPSLELKLKKGKDRKGDANTNISSWGTPCAHDVSTARYLAILAGDFFSFNYIFFKKGKGGRDEIHSHTKDLTEN